MATIASVNINVVANAGKFQAGMKAAEVRLRTFSSQTVPASKQTQAFARHMDGAARSADKAGAKLAGAGAAIKKAFGLAVVIAGVRQFGRVVLTAADSVDQLVKQAARLGIGTDALQGLRRAAERGGVDIQRFDEAFFKLRRRVSEAAAGTGEARGALDELGVSANRLNNLPVDMQFIRIAQAMQGLPNEADRARVAYKLFEDAGRDLLTVLNTNTGELANQRDIVNRLGVTVNTRLGKAVDEAKNSFGDFGQALKGKFNVWLENAAEGAAVLGDVLTETVTGGNAVTTTFNQSAKSLAENAKRLELLKTQYADVGDGIKRLTDLGKVAARDRFFGNAIAATEGKSAADLAAELDKRAREFADSLAKQNMALRLSGENLENYELRLGSVNRFIREEINALRAERTELEANAKAREDAVAKLDEMKSKADQLKQSLRSPLDEFRVGITDLNALFRAGLIDIEQWQKAAERLGDQLNSAVPSGIAGVAPGSPAALEAGSAGAFSAINARERQEMRLLRATEAIERRTKVAEALDRERNRILREGQVRAVDIPG